MGDPKGKLIKAARQLVETDLLFGGSFMPRRQNPLGPSASQSNEISSLYQSTVGGVFDSLIGASLTGKQKSAILSAIDVNEVRPCVKCILCKNRTQTVFGEGDVDAQLVFIGEGPGEEEDRTGRPFVGRAGELLNNMIAAMGLKRRQVYICNVVKCRPPNNRAPAPDEAAACRSYLIRQLQIIAPKVIVTLGNPATQNLLDTKIGITKLRGQWQKLPPIAPGLGGIDVMPTFHSAYVLRQYTADTRGKVWSDLQQVMNRLNIKPKGK